MKICADEGLTHFQKPWSGRVFTLENPQGDEDTLFLLARGEVHHLAVAADGVPLSLAPCLPCNLGPQHFRWMEASLPTHANRQNIEITLLDPAAALAIDANTGHPVVRVSDGSPPDYLVPSYNDPALPAAKIRKLLPGPLNRLQNPDWQDAWRIALWVHGAWTYRNTHAGEYYCPWRIGEILRWGGLGKGPDGQPVIAMCVHYAVAFQQCCLALGTPARLVPLMQHLNGENGHFVSEIWSRSLKKWVLIDPQAALCYLDKSGVPLNALEVAQAADPRALARSGPAADQLEPLKNDFPHFFACTKNLFRHIGVWRWADFYSHPEHGADGHGTTAYAESAILWLKQDRHPPMFPYALKVSDYLKE